MVRRAKLHLSPRGAHWKTFSARSFIPPLAFSIHCINIFVHSLCIVLTLDPGLTVVEGDLKVVTSGNVTLKYSTRVFVNVFATYFNSSSELFSCSASPRAIAPVEVT